MNAKEKVFLTRDDYRNAINAQNACNLSGVVFAWARIMQKICDIAAQDGHGTDWKNFHPINVLFASKVADLTGAEKSLGYSRAYNACMSEIEQP